MSGATSGSVQTGNLVLGKRGHHVYLDLVQRLLLEEPADIFSGDLDAQDRADIEDLGTVLERIAADVTHAKAIGRAIARGDWPALVGLFPRTPGGRDPEWMAAAATVILPLPACHIDAFSLRALGHGLDSAAFEAQRASVEPRWIGRISPAGARPDQLQRCVAQSILAWRGDFNYFDLRMDEPIEKLRLARFAASLRVVASHPDAFGKSMAAVRDGAWNHAEETASALLTAAGIRHGQSMDEPPAIADLVLLAFVPAGDVHAIRSSLLELNQE